MEIKVEVEAPKPVEVAPAEGEVTAQGQADVGVAGEATAEKK